MNERYFKSASNTARQAALLLDGGAFDASHFARAPGPSPLSDEQLEIRRLKDETESLASKLHALQDDWDQKIAAARASAKTEAAQMHQRNDAQLLEALERCLTDAKAKFESTLVEQVEPLSASLAAHALQRLIEAEQDETEWLARVVSRRLETLAGHAIVAVHIAPGDTSERLKTALEGYIGQALAVDIDTALRPGTAKIVLRLGEVEVNPGGGARELLQLLELAATQP